MDIEEIGKASKAIELIGLYLTDPKEVSWKHVSLFLEVSSLLGKFGVSMKGHFLIKEIKIDSVKREQFGEYKRKEISIEEQKEVLNRFLKWLKKI
jgi:hypothetical protein